MEPRGGCAVARVLDEGDDGWERDTLAIAQRGRRRRKRARLFWWPLLLGGEASRLGGKTQTEEPRRKQPVGGCSQGLSFKLGKNRCANSVATEKKHTKNKRRLLVRNRQVN